MSLARPPGRPRKLTHEQTEQIKREYRERDSRQTTMQSLAEKHRVSLRTIKTILHSDEQDESFVMKGELHVNARLTERQVLDIRRRVRDRNRRGTCYPTFAQLAGEFGVTAEHIERIVSRQRWKHVA
jgi:transposase